MTELEVLSYMDLQTELASTIEQLGARQVLTDFRNHYPTHYNELLVQMNRQISTKQIPVLLLKKEN